MKQKICNKCLMINHHFIDVDVLCKNKFAIFIDEIVNKFAIMNII